MMLLVLSVSVSGRSTKFAHFSISPLTLLKTSADYAEVFSNRHADLLAIQQLFNTRKLVGVLE